MRSVHSDAEAFAFARRFVPEVEECHLLVPAPQSAHWQGLRGF